MPWHQLLTSPQAGEAKTQGAQSAANLRKQNPSCPQAALKGRSTKGEGNFEAIALLRSNPCPQQKGQGSPEPSPNILFTEAAISSERLGGRNQRPESQQKVNTEIFTRHLKNVKTRQAVRRIPSFSYFKNIILEELFSVFLHKSLHSHPCGKSLA